MALSCPRRTAALARGAQLRQPQRAPAAPRRLPSRRLAVRAEAGKEVDPKEPPGFGYTRQDAILVSVGLPLLGWAGEAALEAGGMDSGAAGNVVLLTLVGGLTLVWTATYVWRVVNKDMTYVKQLDNYEAAVMAKRLEELPETELAQMLAEVEAEKQRREANPSKL